MEVYVNDFLGGGIIALAIYLFIYVILESDEWHNVYRRSIRKITSIGGTEILECEINYPDEMWEEHIITWRKQVTTQNQNKLKI